MPFDTSLLDLVRVSTDDMPEGGEKSISSVGAILEEYVKDEYRDN